MSGITVRLATPEDKEAVLNLLNEVFNKQQKTLSQGRNSRFWDWKYEQNIFEKAILHVVEMDNEIVGCGTLWPFEFKYKGQILKGLQPCDTVVGEKARGKGLFRKLNEARIAYARSSDTDIIFNFPNENSLPGYLKMGWQFVGKIKWQVKVINIPQVIKGMFSKAQSVKLKVDEKYRLDSSKIEAALKCNNNDPGLLMLNSSVEYYQWRHQAHPGREYGMVEYTASGETAVAIFHLMSKESLKEMVILDVISSKKSFIKLMSAVVKEARAMKVGYLAMIRQENQDNASLLLKGYLPKKNKNFVCLPLKDRYKEEVLQYDSWNLSATLHDSI